MEGKLIIIEGSDSSGKATQTAKLFDRLTGESYNVRKVEFPNYESDSSALIKMYLNGDFGTSPEDVNPYVASTFYAVDRYASFKIGWEKFYKEGGIVLSDRYATSNMIHQAAKIVESEKRVKFLEWLWDFEFNMYKLPIPNCVIFLDMPPEMSNKLMEERKNKFTGNEAKDIHERNYGYLINSYNCAVDVANRYNWNKVSCTREGNIRTIDDIHDEVYELIKNIIKK